MNHPLSTADVTVEPWTEPQFLAAREPWTELLSRSRADPVFLSWDWQVVWWQLHRRAFALKPFFLAARANGRLLGIAPLCRRKARLWGPLTLQRLEVTGEVWREAGTVMSEYLDLVVDHRHEDAVLEAFARYLGSRRDWGQLVAASTRESSLVARLAERCRAQSPSAHLDRTDALTAYRLDLRGGFSEWVRSLPGATRRKAVAHRRRCPGLHHVERDYRALGEALDIMAGFHESRWGRVHFRGLRREFLLELAERDGFRDRIRLSMLCDGDRPVSVMYNLRAGDTEYNIQSAFMPDYSRGISLGYLHIGYCAEALCESGVAYLDLLAGPGRSRDYKRDFAGEATEIATRRLTRAPAAAAAYRLARRWRGR